MEDIEHDDVAIKKYLESFGVKFENGEYTVEDPDKLKAAYQKAWENRDFEINKFWTRAAYFWGFLVLIFGAYFSSYQKTEAINQYIPFYIICMGLIFSFAWTFVIKGSKRWQENWEVHIDKLEDFISGPLYKTINSKGKAFYSVSKINEILSHLIILVWIVFLIEYLVNSPIYSGFISWGDLRIVVGVLITSYFIYRIIWGYGRSSVSVKGKVGTRKTEEY